MHTSPVVIGAGRVGRTVAARLNAPAYGRGEQPDLTALRPAPDRDSRQRDRVGLQTLAPALPPECGVVHFSGATSVSALAAAPGPTASVHPLQTVETDRGPDQLEGAYAAVTGDPELGFEVAERLGMRPFLLADEAKPLYHAATAFASNYLVTLTAVAVSLMERAGIERELALSALRPLQRRTVEATGRPPTGPIARGDAATVAAHLAAIGPDLDELYRALGRATLPLVDPEAAAAVRSLL